MGNDSIRDEQAFEDEVTCTKEDYDSQDMWLANLKNLAEIAYQKSLKVRTDERYTAISQNQVI